MSTIVKVYLGVVAALLLVVLGMFLDSKIQGMSVDESSKVAWIAVGIVCLLFALMLLGIIITVILVAVSRTRERRKIFAAHKPKGRLEYAANQEYITLELTLKDLGILRIEPNVQPPASFSVGDLISRVGFRTAAQVVGSIVNHYNADEPIGRAILKSIGDELTDRWFMRKQKFVRLACLRHLDVGAKLAPFMTTK